MKKSLSQATFEQIVAALQSYKTSDSLEALLSKMAVLTEDAHTHRLFRGEKNLALGEIFHAQAFSRRPSEGQSVCVSVSQVCTSLFGPITRSCLISGASS